MKRRMSIKAFVARSTICAAMACLSAFAPRAVFAQQECPNCVNCNDFCVSGDGWFKSPSPGNCINGDCFIVRGPTVPFQMRLHPGLLTEQAGGLLVVSATIAG